MTRQLPGWVPGTTIYHLHSLGAAGAPATAVPAAAAPATTAPAGTAAVSTPPPGDGLDVLRRWLAHVEWLGCGAVLLTPIAASSTHGYDTVDPLAIDPRMGDEDAWDRFVGEAHDRGLRVVLDAVLNHVGRDFGPFRDVLRHGRASALASWFRIDWDRFEASSGDSGYATFEGHRELVALDHSRPAVLDWAVGQTRNWLDRGADGWRLDAAYALPPAWVAEVVAALGRSHPDALLFGEVIHGDHSQLAAATGLDSLTQYELHKAVWSALHDANLFELAWALQRHAAFAERCVPITFVGNHDVTRLATATGDPALGGAATAVIQTVPGIPCTYYGDELAWEGTKEARLGGDGAIRPPLPADGTAQGPVAAAQLDATRRLIALRRDRPWLTAATLEVSEVASRTLTYRVVGPHGALHVALDVDLGVPSLPPGWSALASGPGWSVGERG